MSDWDDFLTFDNFQLAWKRVLRSKHRYNKDWIGLDVYGANLTTNLNHLIDKLKENVYNPSHAEKMYMPKSSGALRSFPFLYIEDRLVYQAIASIVVIKSKEYFETITRGHVFAHLADDPKSEFMLKKWDGQHGQYKHFLNRFQELLQRGYRYVMEADIASFYDSIDHDLLIKNLNSYLNDNKLTELLGKCLHVWSQHKDGQELSRGLPQGYEASDYFSTLFLLQVDIDLIEHSAHYYYIRYVDDFRILSFDRDSVDQAMTDLDISLKSQALILQRAKTGKRELTDIDDEINRIARKISITQDMDSQQNITMNEAIFMFLRSWRSLKENNQDNNAESRMIFAMNRMPADYLARDFVLDLLENMYHRSMDITRYLAKFKGDKKIIEALIDEIRDHKAYKWHIANCIIALSEVSEEDYRYRNICHDWISDQRRHWYPRLIAVQSLKNDPESYNFLFLKYQKESNYLIRRMILLITTHIAYTNEQKAAMIRIGIKDKNQQIIATAIYLYLKYPDCGINENEFKDIKIHNKMIHTFSGVDFQKACYIKENLTSLFKVKVPSKLEYRAIFNTSYNAAVKSLFYAVASYDTDPNLFVTALDDLNHIIAIAINEEIESEKIPRDKYENLLSKLEALKPKYDDITTCFRKCHDLRCKNPLAHPWAKSVGDWSKDITHSEKDELIKRLCISYQEFTNIFAAKFGIT